MYDPARDIYTLSNKPQTAEGKVQRAESQEHQLDAADTVSPGSHRGMSPRPSNQDVSDIPSTAINKNSQPLSPSQPISSRRDARSGSAAVGQLTSSSPSNHPAQTSTENPPSSTFDRVPSDSNPSPGRKAEHIVTKDSPRVRDPDSANKATSGSELRLNDVAGDKNQPHKRDSPRRSRALSSAEREHKSMDGHTPEHTRNGNAEPHVPQEADRQSPKGNKKPSEDHTEKPMADHDPPRFKRKRQEERTQTKKRAKDTPSAYSRRDASPTLSQGVTRQSSATRRQSPESKRTEPAPKRPRSPSPIRRSPSPDNAAPAPKRKRPGAGARVSSTNIEAFRKRQEEREQQQQEEARKVLFDRGVHEVVTQHYNAVPERGREWRKTDSRIKGLRSFNNWVKSTLIQKFSPDEDFLARRNDTSWANQGAPPPDEEDKRLLVVDIGCGKGGDLGKWQQAPQPIDLYVGLDPAGISIDQARDRYIGMRNSRNRNPRNRGKPLFHAEFFTKDCFGGWIGDIPIIQRVGIDPNVGPDGNLMTSRWGGGGFDVAVCMFTMHYAFESEEKTRQMLRNVAGSLKKGGRFIGVGPNSDIISAKVAEFHEKQKKQAKESTASGDQDEREEGEVEDVATTPEWGNDIYRVRFPGDTPEDGIFRPPFGWKYSYFMEEAVGEIPEYVVPWEAFRALTEDYNLELQYRKPFADIWREEKDDPELGPLSERMGVRSRTDGSFLVSDQEFEAASFYHAFCFYKV